jgi:hypothetical protein
MSLQAVADDHQVIDASSRFSPSIPPCPLSPYFAWVPQDKTPDNRFPRHVLVTAALTAELLDRAEGAVEMHFTEDSGVKTLRKRLPGIQLQYNHELWALAVAKRITTVSPTGVYTLDVTKAYEVLGPYLRKMC